MLASVTLIFMLHEAAYLKRRNY